MKFGLTGFQAMLTAGDLGLDWPNTSPSSPSGGVNEARSCRFRE